MMVDIDDLAGWTELANLFTDLGTRDIQGWYRKRSFNGHPEMLLQLAMGPLFSKQAFIHWWTNWKPLGLETRKPKGTLKEPHATNQN